MQIEIKYLAGNDANCFKATVCGKKDFGHRMYYAVEEGTTREYLDEKLKETNLTIDDVCEDCLAILESKNSSKGAD